MQIFNNVNIPETTRVTVNRMRELGRIPQTVMLTGNNENVKIKCAYELCAAVMCREKDAPCGKCNACKKALGKIHPDITVIQPTDKRKNVAIDDIRDGVTKLLYVQPNEAPNKVFILTGASDYSVLIQNALLKSIEEPPEDCMFILLCDQRNDMLSTIISRSSELFIGDSPEGKPRAKDIKADEAATAYAKALAAGNEFSMLEVNASLGKERDILNKTAEKLGLIVRDAIVYESGAALMSGHEPEAKALSSVYGAKALSQIKFTADDILYRSGANGNVALTVSLMSSGLGKIIREYYNK